MKKIVFTLMSTFFLGIMHAQFIAPSAITLQNLNASQLSRFQTIDTATSAVAVSTRFIEFNTISSSNINGNLEIITGYQDQGGFVVNCTYLDFESDGDFVFVGQTIELDPNLFCVTAFCKMVMENGTLFGKLSYAKKDFDIYDLGGGIGLLVELDNSYDFCDEVAIEGVSMLSTLQNTNEIGECYDCTVDILVIIDPQARISLESSTGISIVSLMNMEEASFNNAEKRSSHNSEYAEIDLIGPVESDLSTSSLNNSTEFLSYHINSTTLGLRNQYNADLVSLWIYDFSFKQSAQSHGAAVRGDQLGGPSPSNVPFNYVNWIGSPALTLEHEVGHNFGAKHSNDTYTLVANKAYIFQYRNWCLGKKRDAGTIVVEGTSSVERIPYFSNPNIKYKNAYIGVFGKNFNHYYIENNKCDIAAYKGLPGGTYYILATSYACPLSGEIVKACNTDQDPAQSYSWYRSSDGISWTYLGNGYTEVITMPSLAGQIVYVKLEMVTSSGSMKTLYHSIQTSGSINGLPCTLKTNESISGQSESTKNDLKVDLETNPVKEILILNIENADMDQTNSVTICDIQGRVMIYESIPEIIESELKIPIQHLAQGSYIVTYKNGGNSRVIKFVKL